MPRERTPLPAYADDSVEVIITSEVRLTSPRSRACTRSQPSYKEDDGDENDEDELHEGHQEATGASYHTRLSCQSKTQAQHTQTSGPDDRKAADEDVIKGGRKRVFKDPNKLYNIIDGQDATISSFKLRLKSMNERRENDLQKLATSKQQTREKKNLVLDLQSKIQDLKTELKEAKLKIAQLEGTLERQDTEIREYQEEAFSRLDQDDFAVDLDDKVAAQLEKLLRQVSSWAHKHAMETWQDVDAEAFKIVLAGLRRTDLPEVVSARGRKAVRKGLVHPRIVVNALMNRDLVFATVYNPFRMLTGAKTGSVDASSCDLLEETYAKLLKEAGSMAGRFRCMAMMALKPQENGIDNIVKSAKLKDRISAYSQLVSQRILKSVHPLLKVTHGNQEDTQSSLYNLVQQFGVTAVAIHAQYPHTTFDFGERLQWERFTHPHNLLSHHPAKQLRCDEGDSSGMTIEEAGILNLHPDVIIEPLIRRSGDNVGRVWEIKRVIHRAVVWVCSSQELERSYEGAALQRNAVGGADACQTMSQQDVTSEASCQDQTLKKDSYQGSAPVEQVTPTSIIASIERDEILNKPVNRAAQVEAARQSFVDLAKLNKRKHKCTAICCATTLFEKSEHDVWHEHEQKRIRTEEALGNTRPYTPKPSRSRRENDAKQESKHAEFLIKVKIEASRTLSSSVVGDDEDQSRADERERSSRTPPIRGSRARITDADWKMWKPFPPGDSKKQR